jgi:AcrR family transcriptional regulator
MAGRPRSFDRQKALDIAVEQFWRNGYDETTVASLTKAMGIAAPSLYAAFGDKDQLFAEAAACYCGRTLEAIDRALDQPTTRASIEELLKRTGEAHVDPDTPMGCFVVTEPRLADKRELLRASIQARLQRGLAEGDLPAGTDPEQLSNFLIAVITGMSTRARDGASADEVQSIGKLALGALPDTA